MVHAARKLFLEGGYAKTSMDSIAEAAGVGSELLTAGMVVCP
ncbi:MAG: helix-turn-helix domain-containing protein [Syntrophobacteraceae bacterium]